ncbi:hypothetical protein ACS0TY_027302 [Phlomoides rotata]
MSREGVVCSPMDVDDEVVDLGVLDAMTVRQPLSPIYLVGRFCTGKSFNAFALIDILTKAFRPKGKLFARDWGKGVWIFSFERDDDR